MLKNLNELSRRAHENAVLKGFWDKDRGEEPIVLIISELYELLEAVRHEISISTEMIIKINNLPDVISKVEGFEKPTNFLSEFSSHVNGSIGDECADVVIGCLDYIRSLQGENDIFFDYIAIRDRIGPGTFNYYYPRYTSFIYELNEYIYKNETIVAIFKIIAMIDWYCEQHEIDLQTHIELKMRYNESRTVKRDSLI